MATQIHIMVIETELQNVKKHGCVFMDIGEAGTATPLEVEKTKYFSGAFETLVLERSV